MSLQPTDVQGVLSSQVGLARYNTWRVGGLAARLYKPASIADLACFLQTCAVDEPIAWLGLGSNTLVLEQGFAGTVVITQGCLMGMTLLAEGRVRVEAGVSCAQMARFCVRHGLEGGEFWAGIPGTMGGALRMNAGCFGRDSWQSMVAVETLSRNGVLTHRTPGSFNVAYRDVQGLGEDEWFVAATYQFEPGDKRVSQTLIKALLTHRAATQPTGTYNCGSVFRNPEGSYAGQLIESCGLKGYRLGGAVVSEKHANFIVNHQGLATADDIAHLMAYIHETVLQQTGISLVREVHVLGEK